MEATIAHFDREIPAVTHEKEASGRREEKIAVREATEADALTALRVHRRVGGAHRLEEACDEPADVRERYLLRSA